MRGGGAGQLVRGRLAVATGVNIHRLNLESDGMAMLSGANTEAHNYAHHRRTGGSSRWLRGVASLLVFGALFGLSTLLVVYASLRGRTVRVPNLVLLKESAAQDELEDAGLIMQVRARAPHQQVPFGAVADQTPAPGAIVKTGQIVRVTLSTGSPPSAHARNGDGSDSDRD